MNETFGVSQMMTTDEWWEIEGREYHDLALALVSRPLTIAELQRVGGIGYRLLVTMNEPYNGSDKRQEFAAMLAIQHAIQLVASREFRPLTEQEKR